MFGWMSARSGETKRMTEVTGAYDGGASGTMSGLSGGTKVATGMGWRSVDAIAEGDKVLTFDAGLQTVTKVVREKLWQGEALCPKRFWPLEVPAGVLGNRDLMHVLPHQSVMLESDAAEEIYGDPFSLIAAEALEGLSGIHRSPPPMELEVVLIYFEDEQVVFADNGALFFCPSSRDLLDCIHGGCPEPIYSVLPHEQARQLAGKIEAAVGSEKFAPAFA